MQRKGLVQAKQWDKQKLRSFSGEAFHQSAPAGWSLLLDWSEVWQVGITGFIGQRQAVLSVKCDPEQRKLGERKEIDNTVNPAMKAHPGSQHWSEHQKGQTFFFFKTYELLSLTTESEVSCGPFVSAEPVVGDIFNRCLNDSFELCMFEHIIPSMFPLLCINLKILQYWKQDHIQT